MIADDLTGAADCGIAFGRPVRVTFGPGPAWEAQLPPGTLQVHDTETRHLSAAEAARVVEAGCRALRCGPLFKKMDSTLRGSPGAEIEAILKVTGLSVAVVAPALPDQGRTVSGGSLRIGGAAVANVSAALRATTSLRVELVELPSLARFGPGVAVLDAVSDAELREIAGALTEQMLPVGSAGLARAIAASGTGLTASPPPRCSRVIVLAGTENPVTAGQLEAIRPSPALLVRAGQSLEKLTAGLAEMVGAGPSAVIATGGETALAACRALGAMAIWPRGELAPGMPWSEIEGRPDTWLVSKAGGFGGPRILAEAVARLLGTGAHG